MLFRSSLLSAFSRMQHVFSTTTSASESSSTAIMPSLCRRPEMRSESCSFIWHPKVRTTYFCGPLVTPERLPRSICPYGEETTEATSTHFPDFFVWSMAESRCFAADLAVTEVETAFVLRVRSEVFRVLVDDPTFEEIELTTTLHVALAHVAAATFSVSIADVPIFLRVTFADNFELTLNVAGATPDPMERTPAEVAVAANLMSGMVTNQPSTPLLSTDQRVHVGVP